MSEIAILSKFQIWKQIHIEAKSNTNPEAAISENCIFSPKK